MKKDVTKYLEKKEKDIKELNLINYKLNNKNRKYSKNSSYINNIK